MESYAKNLPCSIWIWTGLSLLMTLMDMTWGDRLLKAVSRRLCKCIRKTDYAFRIGGDEFSLIIEEGNINDEFCEMMVRRIKSVIDRPFDIEGRLLSVDTSCGYAIYPEHSQKIDEIRIMADHRMYEDKTQNRKKG